MLAPESQLDHAAVDEHVAFAQRRDAERAVRTGVLLVTDADAGVVDDAHDERDLSLQRRAAATQVLVDREPELRERGAERRELFELRRVAVSAEVGVVSRLLPASRVASGCLEMGRG